MSFTTKTTPVVHPVVASERFVPNCVHAEVIAHALQMQGEPGRPGSMLEGEVGAASGRRDHGTIVPYRK